MSAWAAVHLLHPVPVPVAMLALATGLALLLVPRLGWLALTAALAAALGAQGMAGTAVLATLAALLPATVLLRRGSSWPLPAWATGLGAVGLAGAWPALAAYAGGPWRRAALGALGWCWLLLGASLTAHPLYVQAPPGAALRSPAAAWHHVLGPLLSSGLMAGALVWALAAAALPVLRRPGSPSADALVVVAWSVATAAASLIALAMSGAGHRTPSAAAIAAGAFAAAVAALAPMAAGRLLAPRGQGAQTLDLRSMGHP